jgi:hypothetical protein
MVAARAAVTAFGIGAPMCEPDISLQSLIEPACRVIAEGKIPSIMISTGRPLEPEEVVAFRAYATKCGVLLSEIEPGTIVVRGGISVVARSRPGWIRSLLGRFGPRAVAVDSPMNPGWAP